MGNHAWRARQSAMRQEGVTEKNYALIHKALTWTRPSTKAADSLQVSQNEKVLKINDKKQRKIMKTATRTQ